jgi:hypothetical protein
MPDFIIIFVLMNLTGIFLPGNTSISNSRCWLFLFLILTLMFPGCRSKRELWQAPAEATDRAFYSTYSQKLGYTLGGFENPELIREVSSWLGTPHRYAGNSREGADCSGFVMEVFRTVYQVRLPRSSADMAAFSRNISKAQLQEGDLVFFRTSGGRRISHVGIYLSNNKFIHASSSRGVVVSDLDEPYYRRTWARAGRVK